MPTILSQLETAFAAAIKAAFGIDADPILAPSQSDKFGDYQSNAAMGLAKQLGKKPREIADQIKAKLELGNIASEVTIAGPGFINVRLNPSWLAEQLKSIQSDPRLGHPLAPSRKKVVVDYSGPNIAKQMHVGHLRSTIIGDAIARVIDFEGDEVIRQNHIGDWGTQFGMLITYLLTRSGKDSLEFALERIHNLSPEETRSEGESIISDLEIFYQSSKRRFDEDEKFRDVSRQMVVRLQAKQRIVVEIWKGIVDETRLHYEPLYERLGVRLTTSDERGESFYNEFLADVVRELKEKQIAVESEGAIVVFADGPDKTPLIIQKSDGGYLYGTTDLAAIRYRTGTLHANRIIYTHDSRQAQHFAQVFWTAKKAGWADGIELEYAPFGTMLGEDGKPFKSRSGDTVKLKDLLDEAEERGYQLAKSKDEERVARAKEKSETAEPLTEDHLHNIGKAVGIGGVKYADLSKERTSDYVFSFDKMLSMDGNTAPYLQYAHARIKSIFRKSGMGDSPMSSNVKIESPHELALTKHVLRFPEIVNLIARELKPHHLCTYLYELAQKFSGFYENCPVLQSEEPTRSSRLALCDVTAKTLAKGLDLLGIAHPEQM